MCWSLDIGLLSTQNLTLLDAGHFKITEILFVGKISRKVYSPEVLLKDEAFALDVMVTGAANETEK